MSTLRASPALLRSLAVVALACSAGCGREAATPAAAPSATPAPLRAELHGARLLRREPGTRAPVPVFDARRGPVLRLHAAPPAGARLVLDAGPLHLELPAEALEARGDAFLLRPAPEALAALPPEPEAAPERPGTLRLEAADARVLASFELRWGRAPETLPFVAALTTDRQAGRAAEALARLEAAWAGLDAETRLWAAPERARLHQQLGRVDAVREDWRVATQLALDAALPGEASRRMRAAAFFARWQRDIAGARALLDDAERHARAVDDVAGLAGVQYHRSQLEAELGRYGPALTLLHDAAETHWLLGLDDDAAGMWRMEAPLLQDQGRHADALAALERLRPGHEARRTDAASWSAYLGIVGWVRLRAMLAGALPADFADARRTFEAALAALGPGGSQSQRVNYTLNLAWAMQAGGDTPAARAALDSVRASLPAASGIQRLFAAWLDAELFRLSGQWREARAAYTRAEIEAREDAAGGESDALWQARYGLGRVQAAQGDARGALKTWRAALDILGRVSRRAPLQGSRAAFVADRRGLVRDLVSLSLAQGDPAGAFLAADRARALLADALSAQVRLDALPPPALAAWQEKVGAYLTARAEYERNARRGETLPASEEPAWRAARERERQGIARAFDAAWEAVDAPAPVETPDRLPALAPDEALLAGLHLADGWRVFTVRDGRVTLDAIDLAAADPLAPLDARLSGVSRLYVIPDGLSALAALPLRVVDGVPMGTRLGIATLPSGRWLDAPGAAATGPALIVADADGSLPAARREAARVHAAQPGARMLVGEAATRAALLGALDGPRLFHYAGHGRLDAARPWETHLSLGRGESVTLADLLAARPRLGLVVLSGCETGARAALAGDAALGLPDALLAAGAASVLAATEVVPDDAAARFIEAFYAEGGADAPMTALPRAAARLETDRDPAWRAWRLSGGRNPAPR